MIVKFEDYSKDLEEIGRANSKVEANKIILDFLETHKYNKGRYWRHVYFDDYLWIDFGSWSKFFRIYPENDFERDALFKQN